MTSRIDLEALALHQALDRLGKGVHATTERGTGTRRPARTTRTTRSKQDLYERSPEAIEAAKRLRDRIVPD